MNQRGVTETDMDAGRTADVLQCAVKRLDAVLFRSLGAGLHIGLI